MMASSCKRVVSSVSRRLLHSSTEVVVGELAPRPCNSGKYVVALEGDGLKFSSNRELLQYYVNTLKQVVGSEDEAKKKIYFVSPEWDALGFGAEIDVETSNKLKGLANVDTVTEDYHIMGRKKLPIVCSHPVNWNRRLHNMFCYKKLSEELTQLNTAEDPGHWIIHIDIPNGGILAADKVVDHCKNLLANFVESKSRKEAKTRIYAVWCVKPFGFGAEMDKKTAELLKGSKTLGVIDVLPDYAFDIKDKAFGTLIISPSGKDDDPDIAYVLPEVPEIDSLSDEDDYERELCTEDDESDSCLDSEDDESERDSFPDDSKLKL